MAEDKKNALVEKELEILELWKSNKIFERSLEQSKSGPAYSFYDGPPFATGTPHYGHLVASVMKDAVPRYWTMKGHYVSRRWGWDCHGLPIENIVEKELGFKSKKDILDFGVDKFNEACRSKVLAYADQWKKTISRFGRWADMENPYQTMDRDYMESVWWVFKELWDKGLVYEGYKSMHICPRCETTLSQQEVSEGYKDIKDLSVTAEFELVDDPGTFVLAWTTTPWTLPGNVALAVGEDVDYVKVKAIKKLPLAIEPLGVSTPSGSVINERYFLFAEPRFELIKKEAEKDYAVFKIVKTIKGLDLVGKKYKPLFPYYKSAEAQAKLKNAENLYTIVSADFVTTEDGTGVVHIAPAFGEEDMKLGQEKNLSFIQNVTLGGNFTDEVIDFAGLNVKPAEDTQQTDVKIIKYLASSGLLFEKAKYEHSYPHCWRCDTPLINYATSSWFVKITEIKERAVKLAQPISWSPEHIKEGRFGKWLEGARDWSISRQRFWASVIPIWKCAACGAMKVYGAVKDLEQDSGQAISDLHKHHLDQIELPCSCGQKLKRIPDVLDTWFDSGSMPYAQMHYPFENVEEFEQSFPAKFIGEGVDQTRAWFYYLHVIAASIKGSRAFDNVIVNGIVLADDGKKMSKKLQNYPEPEAIMEKYGADALRYYLLSAPVMSAENMIFSEAGVREAMQKVVMLSNNILSFYKLYEDESAASVPAQPVSILDRWLLAKLNLLAADVSEAMENYDLPRSVRPIGAFIDEFSTWWLRRSRDRFKGEDESDKRQALAIFKHVLLELAKVMAPFTPFVADHLYREAGGKLLSVHLDKWPAADKSLIDQAVLDQMELARKLIEQGLAARAEAGVKIRQPLAEAVATGYVISEELLLELRELIKDELNVKQISFAQGAELKVELDVELTEELKTEGVLRELVRTINGMRKDAGLTIGDRINISWESESTTVRQVLSDPLMSAELKRATLTEGLSEAEIESKPANINGEKIKIMFEKI